MMIARPVFFRYANRQSSVLNTYPILRDQQHPQHAIQVRSLQFSSPQMESLLPLHLGTRQSGYGIRRQRVTGGSWRPSEFRSVIEPLWINPPGASSSLGFVVMYKRTLRICKRFDPMLLSMVYFHTVECKITIRYHSNQLDLI